MLRGALGSFRSPLCSPPRPLTCPWWLLEPPYTPPGRLVARRLPLVLTPYRCSYRARISSGLTSRSIYGRDAPTNTWLGSGHVPVRALDGSSPPARPTDPPEHQRDGVLEELLRRRLLETLVVVP